jgi:hypothetical protein
LRKHLAVLRRMYQAPCSCRCNRRHARECREGALILRGQIEMLRWLLDGDSEYDRFMERMVAILGRVS